MIARDVTAAIRWRDGTREVEERMIAEYAGLVAPGRVLAVVALSLRFARARWGVNALALTLGEARAHFELTEGSAQAG